MIIIHPFAKKLLSGRENPKNYPYWEELVQKIPKSIHIIQMGIDGEEQLVEDFRKSLSILELKHLLNECQTWIGVDSFFQHLAWSIGKKGIALWSVSDPLIYGHPENINLLSSRDNLASNQFLWWEHTPHDPSKFVKPDVVLDALKQFI
jgi:ADP-heptose:LPS heptosyltransferase